MPTVIFRDQTLAGRPATAFAVADLPGQMTARELIRLRIREEVARHNTRPSRHFTGLVRPQDAEIELNGHLMPAARRIDGERQAAAAERAFLRNGFIVLAGDRQIEDLDEVVDLTTDPELTFIRLIPLAGG